VGDARRDPALRRLLPLPDADGDRRPVRGLAPPAMGQVRGQLLHAMQADAVREGVRAVRRTRATFRFPGWAGSAAPRGVPRVGAPRRSGALSALPAPAEAAERRGKGSPSGLPPLPGPYARLRPAPRPEPVPATPGGDPRRDADRGGAVTSRSFGGRRPLPRPVSPGPLRPDTAPRGEAGKRRSAWRSGSRAESPTLQSRASRHGGCYLLRGRSGPLDRIGHRRGGPYPCSFAPSPSPCWGSTRFPVEVETDITHGLPSYTVVGLPGGAVRESDDGSRAAVRKLRTPLPGRKVTSTLPRPICERTVRFSTCRSPSRCSPPRASCPESAGRV